MSKDIKIARTVKELRRQTGKWRKADKQIALVPTMGALHDGHLSLVKLGAKKCERVVVSIFVNPTQFAPSEDLARYPRDLEGDIAKLEGLGVDLVWAPDASEMYPDGFSTAITAGTAAEGLEGAIRPHHFGGVATVCCKLFSQVTPDIAIFGEKDYQQLTVLKQMVRDLDLPLKIVSAPTLRAADGLALSSRNAYLSETERAVAPMLHQALSELALAIEGGADIASGITNAKRKLVAAGFASVDYIELRDAETLGAIEQTSINGDRDQKLRLLAAARLGRTRLIDNVGV